MARNRILQIYRGTTAQNDAFTGAQGELAMDTTLNELRVHDGITPGGHKIGSGYHPDLFTWQWADHELNDVQWLRADTFSWQSGAVYQAAYQHLADDITGKTLKSETISGTTIRFYLADDGHKICPAGQESIVTAIYNATGVAWYYIIDVPNKRFKLPRTKFGFTGIRNSVGGYVDAGLPNITGTFAPYVGGDHVGIAWDDTSYQLTGAFYRTSIGKGKTSTETNGSYSRAGLGLDASRLSSVYGNSDTVQPKATEMYLYFYVGNFTQTALENTAGLNAELFNGKADLDFGNTTMIDYVVEKQDPSSSNNYTWYRKYKSGWVEQGGYATNKTVSLPITMSDANYETIINALYDSSGGAGFNELGYVSKTTTSFTKSGAATKFNWVVYGMAAN